MNKLTTTFAMAFKSKRDMRFGNTEVRYISRKGTPGFDPNFHKSEACLMYYNGDMIASYAPETGELYLTTYRRTRVIFNRFNAILHIFGLPELYNGGRGEWYFHGSDQRFDGGVVLQLKN